MNSVYKIPPYIPDQLIFHPQESITDQDIDDLVSWGMNLMGLGVMWEAVERSPGVYNLTYLEEINKLINKLG